MKPLVIFVDDEEIILQGLSNQLRPTLGRDYTLEFTTDATEALEVIEEFDSLGVQSIVVSDWIMPGLNGDAFLREIHTNFPKTKKIILTGQANQEDVKSLMTEIGIERAIRKPWEKEDLINLIEEINQPEIDKEQTYILCVDDEKNVLVSLKNQLKQFFGINFIIEVAESGVEAIELLEELEKENNLPHLIISDQIMPGMKGDELLAYVKENYPQMIRVLLTGQSTQENIIRAINNAGLYRFLSKPWNIEDLNLTVKSGLESYDSESKVKEEQRRVLNLYLSLEEKVQERTKQIIIQNELIEAQNVSIKSSITYAKRIQDAILPETRLIKDYFSDAFVFYKPKDIVSGDFYLFWEAEDQQAFIATIDCTGHGVPGAFLTIITKFVFEIISNKQTKDLLPNEILYRVNEKIISNLSNEENTDHPMMDGMDIALCKIDYKERRLDFAGAYHSLVYIKGDELSEVRGDRRSIGFTPTGKNNHVEEFKLQTINFDLGDRIYMMSDGYPDQFGGLYDKKFRKQRVLSLIRNIQHRDMETQAILLKSELDKWKKDNEQTDDIVFIGLEL